MFGKPTGGASPDHETDAKMKVLEELRQMALDSMGDKLGSKLGGGDMKQVSVMAPDQKGLAQGLDMAKQVAGKPDAFGEGSPAEEASESPSMEASEDAGDDSDFDDMSPQELDMLIKELQMKKQEKLMKG